MNNSLTEKTIFQTSKASAENTTGNLFGFANKNSDTDWLIKYYGGSTKSCYIGGKDSLYSINLSSPLEVADRTASNKIFHSVNDGDEDSYDYTGSFLNKPSIYNIPIHNWWTKL